MKAILFDLDGVLIDSEVWFYELNRCYLIKRAGTVSEADLKSTVGMHMSEMYKLFNSLIGNESLEATIEDYEIYYKENEVDFSTILKPTTREALEELKNRGYKIAVCSSSPMDYIHRAITANHLQEYIDLYLSGDDFKQSKPNPEIYLTAANKLNCTIDECLVVEDSSIGIEAGKRANMKVAAMKEPFGLDQSKADCFITVLADLLQII